MQDGNKSEPNDSYMSDDEQLYRELRQKVNEFYGGRENVAIDDKASEDSVEFRVKTAPDGSNLSTYRAAWFTVTSIVVLVVVSVSIFAVMVKVGAVHDGSARLREYDMPNYRSRPYMEELQMPLEGTGNAD